VERNFNAQRVVWFCALLLIWQLGITRVEAQGTAATILGTVTDPSGAAVAGAAISVRNVATGIIQNTVSDGQGRYRVPELPVGDFEVTAMNAGFSTVLHSGITVTVGAQIVVDFSLPVGQQQQTVTVQGEASQVETTTAAVSNLVESTQMRELPLNGRNFSQLITLSPGVVSVPATGSNFFGGGNTYSVSGSRPEGQAFLLDNGDISDFMAHGIGSGALGTSLGIDAIGEFQTLTNTYSAQFGGNGAVINAVTKSGTNSFHGSAYEFLRNSDLDARNFFDPLNVPAYRRNQYGGTLGGPVKKNKAFFFVNYEGLRQVQGQSVKASVPDNNARNGFLPCNVASTFVCNAATNLANVGIAPSIASAMALFPTAGFTTSSGVAQIFSGGNQAGHENYLVARGDYTISDKDSLTLRYVRDTAQNVSPFPSNDRIAEWPEADHTASHFATVQERHIFSATLINLFTDSYDRPTETGKVQNETPPLSFYPGTGLPDGDITTTGLTLIGPNPQLPFDLQMNKFVESDDVIWTHGAHSFTFGASVNRQQDNAGGNFQQGTVWNFTSLLNLMQAKAASVTGGTGLAYNAQRALRETRFAFYANDSWKVTPKLTLTLGLRYEPATNPTDATATLYQVANPPYGPFQQESTFFQHNPYMKDWDPRFGFAYDPFKDHKTSVRGGFGIFFDPSTARLLGSCSYGLPPAYVLTQTSPTYPIPFLNAAGSLPSVNPACDWTSKKTPYMMQWNMTVQRDIGFGTILSLGYVASRGVNLIGDWDWNAPISSIERPVVIESEQIDHARLLVAAALGLFAADPLARILDHFAAFGYVLAGVNAPAVDFRGLGIKLEDGVPRVDC
jgi:outer membrane receptor protein involved in Fe transport